MSSGIFSFNYEGVITILVLTVLLCLGAWFYGRSIEKATSYQGMSRLSFLVFSVVQWVRRNVSQIMGNTNPFVSVIAMALFSCLWFSNVLCILGFAPVNSIVVPFSFSAFVFVMTIFFGIYYRGRKFFSDYVVKIGFGKKKLLRIIDPLKILSELSKILSLACRLWGNTLAGSLILHIIYSLVSSSMSSSGTIEYLGPILIPFFVFPIHIYFDIFGPGIQAAIFMLLTLVYWSLARHGEGAHEKQDNVAKYKNIG